MTTPEDSSSAPADATPTRTSLANAPYLASTPADRIAAGVAAADILWKQYSLHIDLYKFYFDLTIKVSTLFYAITGAILTYYFTHPGDGFQRYALLFPAGMSILLGGMCFYGAQLLGVIRDEVFNIKARLGLETAPEILVLVVYLRMLGALMLLVAGGVLWAFIARVPRPLP